MGVTGLWKLIEPCGKPVPVETLEGKILAVDISIWLHQVIKGFQDSKGSALHNAHLLGLFHRLCKLLYYRVRPVFIFDGCVPQLKRDTIARRQQQRSKLSNEADRIQALLLQSLAKEKVVQQALGTNAELLLKSPVKRGPATKNVKNDDDDIFKLPDLPDTDKVEADVNNSFSSDQYASTTSDSSFDESTARHAYNSSLQAIDVRSQHFRSLPADVRHEILTDIKETRKQSSWGRLHELPARSDDFCSFQMKRLLKRRAVQESLEEAQQEMGGHTVTYAELCDFFNDEGIVTPTAIEQNTRQISSDEHTRFLLVRDLKKKAMENTKLENTKVEHAKVENLKLANSKLENTLKSEQDKEPPKVEILNEDEELPCTSAQAVNKTENIPENKPPMTEYDSDLALAMALSLEETQKVYDEKDYEYDSDQDLRLNREQSKQLRHAAKGPARAYMIEYGGMNEDEVDNILEKTQLSDTQILEGIFNATTVNDKLENVDEVTDHINEECVQVTEIDTDTDSDLEEVLEEVPKSLKNFENAVAKQSIEICVDLKEQSHAVDDLFADIFEDKNDNCTSSESKDLKVSYKDAGEYQNTNPDVKNALIKQVNKNVNTSTVEMHKEDCKTDVLAEDNKSIGKLSDHETDKVSAHDEVDKPKIVTEAKPNNIALILADLKRQTDEVKNITLVDLTEQKSDSTANELSSILDEIKRKTGEVKNIQQEAIQPPHKTIINISSDEDTELASGEGSSHNAEIIELIDSDDNQKTRNATTINTPPKNKSISEYFETKYLIKRTPDKCTSANTSPPTTPKVTKPFFVKRTPKSSGRKRAAEEHSDEAASPPKKCSKASKSLFHDAEELDPTTPLNTMDLLQDAAEALKSQNTAEELQSMANTLAQERRKLETERNRQDRMGMSIGQRMVVDCQELLHLFGIPYIVAPMEAEAQCAFLNAVELTNGTITDDSDIWLFGGRTVYKNFFAQHKHVLEFRADQIEQIFNCNRNKLIQLACLVGSDYTTGIHGIGAVTAMEILASFSSSSGAPIGGDTIAASNDVQSVLSTLNKFRDWWQAQKQPGSSARLSLRKKLKNIEMHEDFPSAAVVEAYLTPKVDDNRDMFSWGSPDVESIREFTRKTFGWTTSKTDDILMPVMKKINEKKLQSSIRNYFTAKSALRVQQPKVSKRVQTAIDKMSGKICAETPEKPKKAARKKQMQNSVGEAVETETVNKSASKSKATRRKHSKRESSNIAEEEATEAASSTKPSKCPRLPTTEEIIPQRQRDLEEISRNRAKAVEVFKKAALRDTTN
ncbi:DNA repair protein complementing XP-G cells homolog [Scaptodrosophila lebanonensis]|uniref:DNA repair protein complementing XP-G cells homolog n=1 Tax=Drosophila lebanonensis TaxID=7225 RepID=A0A6J2TY97_DROLE|nr:DNA repair protein complementing XP-G cells homolog [Scaptodrosophila lebanonensis]